MLAADTLAVAVEVRKQALILDDECCDVVERLVEDWLQDVTPELEDPGVR
jgi:hypothetical protein